LRTQIIFTSNIFLHSSGFCSEISHKSINQALLIIHSVFQYFSSASEIALFKASESVTSTFLEIEFFKSNASSFSILLANKRVGYQFSENNCAVAFPIPELAPVITISGLF
jgi:hypothetical protein